MKEIFDDFDKQGRYILRLIKNSTDIEKICQFCGKPGSLKNNKISPYEIQMVCKDCQRLHWNNRKNGMFTEIPFINIKERFIGKKLKNKMIKLNKDYIKKIKTILKGGYNNGEAVKYLDVSVTVYNKLVDEYEKLIDSDVKSKLAKAYKDSQRDKLMTVRQKQFYTNKYNNLAKIKMEKHISNRDIEERTGGKITICSLSYITNGKTIPKNTTMALLAEALDCSIKDIFPDCKAFDKVYDMKSLKLLMEKTYAQIVLLYYASEYNNFSKFLVYISNETKIPFETLRNFVLSTKNDMDNISLELITSDRVEIISDFYNKNIDDKSAKKAYTNCKIEEIEDWKKRMKPRRS